MIDYERSRRAMICSQLRPNQVTDRRLLTVMGALPREAFVPAGKRSLAYMDEGVEVWPSIDGAPARFLLAPMVLARLIQLAAIGEDDTVLDVGCATGYSTAVFGRLARSVIGLEAEPELAAAAKATLQELAIPNARIVTGPLNQGHAEAGPYDVILLNGSVPEVPKTLTAQLKQEGRLVAVVANGIQGKGTLFVRTGDEASGLPHFDAGAKPLPGFAPEPCFIF